MRPLAVERDVIDLWLPYMLGISVVGVALARWPMGRFVGGVLLTLFVLYLALTAGLVPIWWRYMCRHALRQERPRQALHAVGLPRVRHGAPAAQRHAARVH